MAIIQGIKVSGYIRRLPKSDKPDPILMEVLAIELDRVLSEPLDRLDMDASQRARIREAM